MSTIEPDLAELKAFYDTFWKNGACLGELGGAPGFFDVALAAWRAGAEWQTNVAINAVGPCFIFLREAAVFAADDSHDHSKCHDLASLMELSLEPLRHLVAIPKRSETPNV